MSNVKTSAAGAHKPLPRALIIALAVLTAIGLGCWFYSLAAESDVVQSLNRLFIEAGFAPSGKYCEASDQIGMELSFMKFCVDREIEATLEEDEDAARAIAAIKDRFFDEHLGRWMASYGEAMRRSAQTGYYRAIADLLTSLSS